MSKINAIPTLQDIQEVHERILSYIHRTPVLTSSSLNEIAETSLFFKCENFQKVGAFKMRGAANAVLSLTEEEKERGVATHSSGNHAQALALAAQELGIKAYIVMPENTPEIKKKATEGYGADVIICENNLQSREDVLKKVLEETNATMIHPYDNYDVIAGQATAAKELLEEISDLDFIVSPVSGGGLLSGTALSAYYLSPKTKVIGAEPKEADDAFRSFQTGVLQKNTTIDTIADGLRAELKQRTFEIIQKHVHQIFTVSEEEIIGAMQLIWERMKIIIEPSCAVPFAVVLANKDFFKNKKVGIILSGGNVDLKTLPF